MEIMIGHPSYGAWCLNHRVCVRSKSSAVRELCKRFVPRARARRSVNEAVKNGYGAFTHTETPDGIGYGIEISVIGR